MSKPRALSNTTNPVNNNMASVSQAQSFKGQGQVLPLTREFFAELIKLEMQFQNKAYTIETLDLLTQFYAKAVEYYDSMKDGISQYFLYKIQDTLAHKGSLKLLMNNANKGDAANGKKQEDGKNVNPVNPIAEHSDDSSDDENSHFKKVKRMEAKRQSYLLNKKDRQSISTIKNEKSKNVNFFLKVENEKALNEKKLGGIIDFHQEITTINNKAIEADLDRQKSSIKERIEARIKENIKSQTLSATISAGFNRTEEEAFAEGANFLTDLLKSPRYEGDFKFSPGSGSVGSDKRGGEEVNSNSDSVKDFFEDEPNFKKLTEEELRARKVSVLEGGDEEIDPDDFGNQLDGNIGEDHESS